MRRLGGRGFLQAVVSPNKNGHMLERPNTKCFICLINKLKGNSY